METPLTVSFYISVMKSGVEGGEEGGFFFFDFFLSGFY
jgi:hypothetical protein